MIVPEAVQHPAARVADRGPHVVLHRDDAANKATHRLAANVWRGLNGGAVGGEYFGNAVDQESHKACANVHDDDDAARVGFRSSKTQASLERLVSKDITELKTRYQAGGFVDRKARAFMQLPKPPEAERLIYCTTQDRTITRDKCYEFSGEKENFEECQKCDVGRQTKKLLAEPPLHEA